ncbi:CbtB domain-containing protein [Microlunatus flavus]|uniref:Cobalt transporter subunit CbtB n=1 Tax=Microlunatus flavus TaxID=1036181 RepID=A0A1H9NPE6_9ACTN|nr:CbtB-domain containing protein [Microlunatus flavus]SER37894.1 cobalt transporter subunit CbtB [Microlunatus flavus]
MTDRTAQAVAAQAPTTLQPVSLKPVPLRQVLPWLVLAALLALVAMYFVGAEQGATSLLNGTAVHEWTHDGRHLLGFPCH